MSLKVLDESLELAKRFENVLGRIQDSVAFQDHWRGGSSDNYEGAVNYKLAVGQVVKSRDPESGHRLILVGTGLDTVVVYERHAPNSKAQSFSLVYNANPALDFLLGGSFLSIARFSLVITDFDITQNIGVSLQNLYGRMDRRSHPTNQPRVQEVVETPKQTTQSNSLISKLFGWGNTATA